MGKECPQIIQGVGRGRILVGPIALHAGGDVCELGSTL
jgi:hypothetical protein